MQFTPEAIEQFRLKLLYKARYHLGSFCADVDDVVQETLRRFLSAANDGKMRNRESIGAFLNGICNNVILEYRRRLWRDPQLEVNERGAEQSVAPEAEILDLRQDIDAGLAQLSQRDRFILCAFFLEEKTKEEICREIPLPEDQFRVALFRAKERFRRIYRKRL